MNILIISYFFPPELTPRAFRTYELVKEFCESGHKVFLFLPKKKEYSETPYKHENLKIVYIEISDPNIYKQSQLLANSNVIKQKKPHGQLILKLKKIKSKIEKFNSKLKYYFFPIQNRIFIKNLKAALLNVNKSFDLLISISYPIETHIGTMLSLIFNRQLRKIKVKVAEYSDPFSLEQKYKIFKGYILVDLLIGKIFDYIVVPTPIAVKSYTYFKRKQRIKVIPQAFNLSNYDLNIYNTNSLPTFAYAGVFYKKSRNPKQFIYHLAEHYDNFKFIIYTIKESYETLEILRDIKAALGNRLEIKYNIERKQLIKELSSMDFLVNFDNSSSNQVPSKLIDYTIAKRPICSISTNNLNPEIFKEFMFGNFEKQIVIDLQQFDIKLVAKKFLELD